MSVNRVTIVGNLGADPDIKITDNDTICTFSVATNEFYGPTSDRKQHTEWHSVVTFGKLAQNCSRYLKKGSRVFMEGRLRTSTYEDKDGKQQTRTKIHPSTVQFLDRRTQEVSECIVLEATESEDNSYGQFESHVKD